MALDNNNGECGGCLHGRTIIIDPNKFQGQSSNDNFSVQTEDLSILVDLTTSKKNRSVITVDGKVTNIDNTNNDVSIKFFKGNQKNSDGTTSLSTRFTDLTTNLNTNEKDFESLGITNIDIDFSSSYAPMITINFIDVRGSSLFQRGIESPYKVFFELPYPIFQLTVKGFYGQAVTYCLHLTKFNSKFNSQTGNFEITANFIGYTYAMLSDILIGYLRAITKTEIGKQKFEEIKKENNDPNLITLNELLIKTSQVNQSIQKLSSNDGKINEIEAAKNAVSSILILRDSVNSGIRNLSNNNGTFIINDENIVYLKPTTSPASDNDITKFKQSTKEILDDYINDIKKELTTLDENVQQQFQLKDADFKPIIYENITLKQLEATGITNTTISELIKSSLDIKILNVLRTNNIHREQPVYIYDFSNVFKKIKDNEKKIEDYDENNKKSIADKLRTVINNKEDGLGIDPTIKNLFNILTVHVEVFLNSIYDVAIKASNNTNRDSELKKLNLDVNGNSEIYPFPEYRAQSSTNTITGESVLEEAWLGSAQGLTNPENIPEVKFVEDLLKALIEVEKENETLLDTNLNTVEQTWYPINPFDTKLFLKENPYNEIKNTINYYDIYKVMLIRAMTYLGISNKAVTEDELKVMARLEANNVNKIILNQKIKDAASQSNKNKILEFFKGTNKEIENFGGNSRFLVDAAGFTQYNYIYGLSDKDASNNPDVRKYLPISNSFNGELFYQSNKITKPNIILFEDSGGKDRESYFIGNYTSLSGTSKPNDGATYLKIISSNDFENTQVSPPSDTDSTGESIIGNIGKGGDGIITNGELFSVDFTEQKITPDTPITVLSNRNLFGGRYGVQEYSNLVYSFDKNKGGGNGEAELYTFFYQNMENICSSSLGEPRENIENFKYNINNKNFDFLRVQLIDNNIEDSFLKTHNSYGKNRELLTSGNISLPYINFCVTKNAFKQPISLFGSRLYFEQKTNEAKAFLFLHTFPWNGLVNWEEGLFEQYNFNDKNQTIFNFPPIRNLFANNAAFIQTPKLWAAFIGALLWRQDINTPSNIKPIFKDTESFIPFHTLTSVYPNDNQYITLIGQSVPFGLSAIGIYKELDDVLKFAPQQVKDEFILVFKDFVNNEWSSIKNQLEINQDNWVTTDWKNAWGKMMDGVELIDEGSNTLDGETISKVKNYQNTGIQKTWFKSVGFKNTENYAVFSPLQFSNDSENDCNETTYNDKTAGNMKYNYFLEVRENTNIMNELLSLVNETVYIANGTYRLWSGKPELNPTSSSLIKTPTIKLDLYVETFITELKNLNKVSTVAKDNDIIKEKIFNTADNKVIKLNIYRTIKSIYDKWIGGTENGNLIFQCGTRNQQDKEVAQSDGRSTPRLIDSFRFLDKGFNDIGQKFFINPLALTNLITENTNQSFYDLASRVLADNNFDFIALPTYIDYKTCGELSKVFKTYSFNEAIKLGTSGPSFVCVYVGQTSNKLDLGNDSSHANDSFDFDCDNLSQIPANFSVPVFAVNFGQQNQNIFKDVRLDQQEFTETEESLKITDSIAQKGSQTNQTFAGQNLFNVYQVRSYKAEVEMLGNAMIQPMMYFQLNNIPMFHGAYLITKVKHSLEPNTMSTVFTGVRIRNVETKLIDSDALYMSMISSLTKSENDSKKVKLGSADGSKVTNYGNSLEISPYVTYKVEEANGGGGLKYQNNISARFAIRENGEFVERLATKWYNDNKTVTDYENVLWLNDLSLLNGGKLESHKTHQMGTSADIKPIANKYVNGEKLNNNKPKFIHTAVGEKNYDAVATEKLIRTALDLGGKMIRNIYFCDTEIRDKINKDYSRDIVKYIDGHKNHLHFEFTIPERVNTEIANNKGKNGGTEEFNPELGGTVAKVEAIPSNTDRLKSLGQI